MVAAAASFPTGFGFGAGYGAGVRTGYDIIYPAIQQAATGIIRDLSNALASVWGGSSTPSATANPVAPKFQPPIPGTDSQPAPQPPPLPQPPKRPSQSVISQEQEDKNLIQSLDTRLKQSTSVIAANKKLLTTASQKGNKHLRSRIPKARQMITSHTKLANSIIKQLSPLRNAFKNKYGYWT